MSEPQNHNSIETRFQRPYRFQCIQCGNCCSDPNTIVNLTYSDILRLQWELDLNLSELLEVVGFYVFENTPDQDQIKKLVIPPIETEQGPAFVALRKKKNGECIFLQSNKKCKIYNARPDICRTFPFHFHGNPKTKPKSHINIEMTVTEKAKDYCPGFDPKFPKINPERWLEIGKQATKDILQEISLVKKWNNAISNGKISPKAKNYLRIILNQLRTTSKQEQKASSINSQKQETQKKSYQALVKKKLEKRKKEKNLD